MTTEAIKNVERLHELVAVCVRDLKFATTSGDTERAAEAVASMRKYAAELTDALVTLAPAPATTETAGPFHRASIGVPMTRPSGAPERKRG
jgi:hypothetical protein